MLPGACVTSTSRAYACREYQPRSLSAVEHGRNEVGAEVLLDISREFGKSLEWPLTGEK
jgi:hypothetical protein